MEIEALHPELRQAYKRIPALPLHRSSVRWMLKKLMGLAPNKKLLEGISIEEKTLGQWGLRIYKPQEQQSDAGLLWIHGGGLILGNAKVDDRQCVKFAKQLGIAVISVEYRLAPKHPYPAAIDDCFAAWQWFQDEAKNLGVNPERIAIAGQSAGGGLAANLAQRIYDADGVQPVAQILFCPMLDDRTAADISLDPLRHRLWSNINNRFGWSAYLCQEPDLESVPPYAVAARREDLSGLPPAWIGVGDIDLFCEEDKHYFERLQAAGVESELHISPQAPHGFESLVPGSSVSQAFHASMLAFLKKALAV
ncbi:alpha/beta hydrolase [Maricurvus nonylphenolicus]|uniref:alpha/beta hydrolase n=1 Tax=Maricurvus nonylphenolicus TaxID=1008307 RepID=UPI0036F31907